MGYESVSALLVLIILVALWFGWLPKRTVNGMKSMLEHREDRFSPSLHLVGEWSVARVCDGTGMLAKGACMQPTHQKRTLTPERIARIRAARRAAIRRRCVLVATLAVLTLFVLLGGVSGLFPSLFVIIPGAMLFAVLYFGTRASKQAREWEARVSKMRTNSKRQISDALYENHNNAVVNKLSQQNRAEIEDSVFNEEDSYDFVEANETFDSKRTSRDDTETSVMQQHEIRVALQRSEGERDEVLRARKESQAAVGSAEENAEYNAADDQDLISFSLDSNHRAETFAESAPESLEIKSTKQVVKAIPVVKAAKSTSKSSSDFHNQEQQSDVDAPESSEDSLGVANLHDVLARRNA